MKNTKIVNRLNEAKSALLELQPYFASNRELLAHETKDMHFYETRVLTKDIEAMEESLTENSDRRKLPEHKTKATHLSKRY